MSSVTTTLLQPPSTTPFHNATVERKCHKCGADLSHTQPNIGEDAQSRILELETQVRILTGKATAAVDKLADYEDELRQLRSSHVADPAMAPPSPSRPVSAAGLGRSHMPSRLSNLLTSNRRATSHPDLKDSTSSNSPTNSADLLTLLAKEQTLRQAAESRVSQTNDELEELSTQLFTEANEMVATERKARAKLEERVAVLERRDKEKRSRLEALESRLGRIERVRAILKKGDEGM